MIFLTMMIMRIMIVTQIPSNYSFMVREACFNKGLELEFLTFWWFFFLTNKQKFH